MLAQQTYNLSTVFILLSITIASITDVRSHRIPNWLTYGTLLIGLGIQFAVLGVEGLLAGLAGAGVGFIYFIPFFLLGGMGAGDVKMMTALGSLVGFKLVIVAASASLVLGGLYALSLMTVKGELINFVQRSLVSIKVRTYVAPDVDSIARHRFPFAVAIAGGTLAALAYYSQLDFHHLTSEFHFQWQLWRAGQ